MKVINFLKVFSLCFSSCMFFTISGCTCSDDDRIAPEMAVESYLDIALNMRSIEEKEDLLDLTTGALKAAIASANDEVIRQAYIDKKYSFQSYAVMERRDRTPREVEITFQLIYQDLGSKEQPRKAEEVAITTTENTLVLIKEKDQWLIREVLGHKTSLDFPISEDSQITAAPSP